MSEIKATPPTTPPTMAPVWLLETPGGLVPLADKEAAGDKVVVVIESVELVVEGVEVAELVVKELDDVVLIEKLE